MRTHVLRGAVTVAMVLTMTAAALAQSIVRGKVTDAQGKPVDGATVTFEAQQANRKLQTKTDKNGEFLQVGLSSGAYKVTAAKDGVGTQTLDANVRQGQGQNPIMNFALSTASTVTPADRKEAAATAAAATAAQDAMRAGNHDEAIAKFNEVLTKAPTCAECYFNIGEAHRQKAASRRGRNGVQEGHRAEARFGRRLHRPGQHLQLAEEVRPGRRGQRQRVEVHHGGVAAAARKRRSTRASSSSTRRSTRKPRRSSRPP